MKPPKDSDFKNSAFLKLHRDEQIKKWYKQVKREDKEAAKPIIALFVMSILLLLVICIDPEGFRFIFHGY